MVMERSTAMGNMSDESSRPVSKTGDCASRRLQNSHPSPRPQPPFLFPRGLIAIRALSFPVSAVKQDPVSCLSAVSRVREACSKPAFLLSLAMRCHACHHMDPPEVAQRAAFHFTGSYSQLSRRRKALSVDPEQAVSLSRRQDMQAPRSTCQFGRKAHDAALRAA
ncbi:hypothetical protein CGRA01v4_02801 [Colletotrichum graminicola]|nr:hypothetical protein CGRA01v4_02801 [Colletotrichum graminicola]